MKRIISLLSVGFLFVSMSTIAQNKKQAFSDKVGPDNQQGTYVPRDYSFDSRVLAHVAVSEDDIHWYREYISAINLKLPVNQPLYYPTTPTRYRKNFANVILDAVNSKQIKAYDDEYFQDQISPEKIQQKMFSVTEELVEDWDTGEEKLVKDTIRITPSQIIELLVREEKFFDKKRSVMDTRILGVCPVALTQNKETQEWEKQKLFWIYFPEARQTLANSNIWNRYNNFDRMTMDEFFTKRLFKSVIKKESNMQDRSIFDYNKRKVDQLLEAERIKEEMRSFEHDLWFY